MLRKKTYPASAVFALVSSIVALTGAGTEDSFIEYLNKQFDKYNSGYSIERTYLMTDRFVYRPGEDLWFKGLVTSGDRTRINSNDFFIRLINDRGEEIIYRRYPLMDNGTSGRLIIPRSCIPGKYWLVAYTGWMKNRCPQEAFRKEILISKYYEKRFGVETMYDKLVYYPGDTLTALIRVVDPAGNPVSETEFDYTAGTLKRSDIKENGKTDIKGKAKLSFIIPETDELLMLTVEIKTRKLSGDFSVPIPTVYGETSVSFFPEGGNLVAGLPGYIGFRVTDEFDLPRMVSGVLTDREGNILDTVSTETSGLGKFEFLPVSDSVYFKITFPRGITQKYPLPAPREKGTIIRYLEQFEDTISFEINSTCHRMQKTYWIGVLNRKIVWNSVEQFNRSKRVNIPVEGIGSGIVQFTVFDENHDIIAERLVRVVKPEEDLNVRMDRRLYKSRQRVTLQIQYPERLNNSDLALSVSLDNLAVHSDYTGFTNLLSTDPCESENSYPSSVNDLSLLASPYMPVNWKEILAKAGSEAIYTRHDGLNGIVYDKKDNLSPHAKVRITHFPNFRFYETQTDENGSFQIYFGTEVIDYRFLNLDAYDATGKTSLIARIDHSYTEELRNSLLKKPEDKEKERIADLTKFGEPDLVYDLRYGPGKFRKSRSDTRKKYDPYQYANYTDVMDIIQDIQPYLLSNNKIYFTDRGRGDSAAMAETILVVNGVFKGTDIRALNNIIPSDITNINISGSLFDVHKYTPLNFHSVIEITTIQGRPRYRQSHVPTSQDILNSGKEFYSPDYSVESAYSADNRKTLYWNPKIPIYKGNSLLVTFYTSDVKGTFFGHITGIDNDGNPVEQTFTFRVE